MRKLLVCTILAATCGLVTTPFAEDLPPISLGSGQSSTQNANGQVVEISVSGPLQATIYLENVKPEKVSGLAVRTSGGTTSGTVTIRWITANLETSIPLSAVQPTQAFSLEGGDGDKRTDPNDLQ